MQAHHPAFSYKYEHEFMNIKHVCFNFDLCDFNTLSANSTDKQLYDNSPTTRCGSATESMTNDYMCKYNIQNFNFIFLCELG